MPRDQPEPLDAPGPTDRGGPGKTRRNSGLERFLKRLVAIGAIGVSALLVAILWANTTYNGYRLGRQVSALLSGRLTGRITVGRARWELRAVLDLLLGTATPVLLDQVRISGPDGREVINAPRVRASVRLWPLIARGELHVATLEAFGGHCTLARMPRPWGGTTLGLVAAFKPAQPAPPRAATAQDGGPFIDAPQIKVRGARFRLALGPTAFDLPGIDVDGWMRIDGDPADGGMRLRGSVRLDRGTWTQNGLPVPLRRIRSADVRIEGQRLSVAALELFVHGTPMHVAGALDHLFDDPDVTIDARATLRQAGTAATRLLGLPVAGAAEVRLRVTGPVAEPRARATFRGVEAELPALSFARFSGTAAIDVARSELEIVQVTADTLDGRLQGTGQLDLESLQWLARVELRGLDPGRIVAPLAGKLDGKVSLSGRLGAAQSGLAVVELLLKRKAGGELLPSALAIRGSAHLTPPLIDFAGVKLVADGNELHARGSINLKQRRTNLFLTLQFARLGRWLELQTGLPLVRSAHGSLRIYGAYPRLKMRGELELRKVGYGSTRLHRVSAQLAFADGTLRLNQFGGQGHGGAIKGEASLRLFEGDLRAPLPRPFLVANLRAERFDLARVGLGWIGQGVVSAQADVNGPLDALVGSARVRIPQLVVQGDTYAPVEAQLGLLRDRLSLYDLRLPRVRGGSLRARGELFHDGRLDVRVRGEHVPLGGLPGASGLPLAGELSGRLTLSGRLRDPRLEGEITFDDVQARGARLGSGTIRFAPRQDAISIKGSLGAGTLAFDGFALVRPRPSLHLSVGFMRFPLHEAIPELTQLGLGQIVGTTSGEVRLDLDSERGLTWATARLSELALSLSYRPRGKRTSRSLTLRNDQELLLTYSDDRLHVVTARLVSETPGKVGSQAQFALGGFLSRADSDLHVRGQVPLGLAEFFLARRVQRISGSVLADVKLRGPISALLAAGELELRGVRVRLPGFDLPIEVPEARLRLAPGEVSLPDLRLRVAAQELRARGSLRLAEGAVFRPETVDVRVRGDLHLGILQLLFPEQLSFARGDARIELALNGPVRDPRAQGDLRISRLELRPRGLGGLVSIQQGRLSFSNYLVCLGGASVCEGGGDSCSSYERTCRYDTPLQGSYDEGTIVASGQARFDQSELVDLELRVRGSSIPQRKPKVYTAELNADLRVLGDGRRLELDGSVDIVDGRYMREFEILRDLVVRPRTHEEAEPFWRGVPILEQMTLRLLLRSSGSLLVRNRNADLALAAALSVSGTLDSPRLDGTLRVEEGSFRVPFLRGEYRVERGDISFDENRPADQAQLDILAETQYIDRGGTDYRIAMQLRGSLERMRIRLTSQPHLDQGQILALLATGRTTDQWRAQINSAEQATAATGVDTQVKELTGTVLGGMIGDPLERAFGLDLVRLEIGTETVTARACKNVGTALEFCGEGEKNLLGGFGGRATMNYKVHDYLRLVGRLERLSTRIEREQENPSRGRVELKFRLPLR